MLVHELSETKLSSFWLSSYVDNVKTAFDFQHMLLLLLSCFSCAGLCATPQTVAHQAPPSLGFSRQGSDLSRPHGLQPTRLLRPWDFSKQEYWSGVPLPSPFQHIMKQKYSCSGICIEMTSTWHTQFICPFLCQQQILLIDYSYQN